jgi:uncharacterized radical SAM protein YgiQ
MSEIKKIFSYRKYWASRFGTAPLLPMSLEEMEDLGWDSCDIIIVTGDAYVDHPSFGMAIIGRLLEAQGFRVGIIAQPDWRSAEDFRRLGRPNLFFGVTSGNMDSMVNRYTADRKIRSDDAYTPDAEAGRRPDRATVAYANRCREAFHGIPVIIGGIETSLRRIAHYDYWSDKVRRSILFDSKADLLVYGNAERQIVEIAHRLARGESIDQIRNLRGTAFVVNSVPEGYQPLDRSHLEDASVQAETGEERSRQIVILPSYEDVHDHRHLYAHASRIMHLETNPGNARAMLQAHGDRYVMVNPPPLPLLTEELDRIYELPFTRRPHPSYGERRIPAYEMIRFSVNIMRGCFGGCTFCSITEHEGRIIQNRSPASIVREIETIRDTVPGFTGIISDIGGPTANMYGLACESERTQRSCRKLSCVHPEICPHLKTSHAELIRLYRRVREIPGVKRVFVASGLRYDLAVRSPEYIRELTAHHVGGYLKIAPEHTEPEVLSKMMKPGIELFYRFRELFDKYSKEAGKEQYLIPYFIASHPGSTERDMLELALWLKENDFRPEQVQNFLPSPLSIATAMYHTGLNPLRRISKDGEAVYVPKGDVARRIQKAFLRYHDPKNWPMLREALKRMGRSDLIGNGKRHLIPSFQPDTEGKRMFGKS